MQILQSERPTIGYRAFPKSVFMVLPENFSLSAESATDNVYMANGAANNELALQQSLRLAGALKTAGIPVVMFPGDANTPDAVFPNNAFASAELQNSDFQSNDASQIDPMVRGRYFTGVMRHPSRQRETARADLHHFFSQALGYEYLDFGATLAPGETAELTGCLVIDRARNIGFCGLSQRCSAVGARAMHTAFGLNKTYLFELASGEYHTNVVLSALGGKGIVMARSGFADPADANQIAALYPDQCVELSAEEKNNFAANCIALSADQLWMSARAEASLQASTKQRIKELGLNIYSSDLSELEKAGGSLRCMMGEIY